MAPKAQQNDLKNKLSRFSAEAYMKQAIVGGDRIDCHQGHNRLEGDREERIDRKEGKANSADDSVG